jgi:hypothetical protein
VRIERLVPAGPSARPFYHHVAGSKSSATAKAEARRNDRRLRRSELPPPVWIELITSDDRHRNQPPPSVWIELITWADWHRDQPPPVTVTALPNPFL